MSQKFFHILVNVGYNLAALDVFAKVMKVTNHTEQWDIKFAWYSPSITCKIYLYGLRIYSFRLVGFYGILTLVGYLMPNHVYCCKLTDCIQRQSEGSFFNSYYRCREGCYSFPWIAPFTLDPYLFNAKCLNKEALSTVFWVFGMAWPRIEFWSLEPLANTLTIMPMEMYI